MSSQKWTRNKKLEILCIFLFLIAIINIFMMVNRLNSYTYLRTDIQMNEKINMLKTITNIGFCGELQNKFDKRKYFKPLNDFHNLQFRLDTENDKYLIVENFDHFGIASKINVIHPLLTLSIATNRKFLFYNSKSTNWKWLHKSNGKTIPFKCENRKGRNCFFKKHSNINNTKIKQLMKQHKNNTFIIDLYICSDWLKNKINTINKFETITKNYKIIY
eukprot:141786_1